MKKRILGVFLTLSVLLAFLPAVAADITVKDSSGSVIINLTQESVDWGEIGVKAYSTNGGKTWKKGAPPEGAAAQIKLFDKGLHLCLALELDSKGKPVQDKIITLNKIEARPKKNPEKLVPYYTDNDMWVLVKKGTTEPVWANYEYVETVSGKKPQTGCEWKDMDKEGLPVQSKGSQIKYLVRLKASVNGNTYTPASKPFTVKPKTLSSAPKVKIDYLREVIVLKKGDAYSIGSEPYKTVTAKRYDLPITSCIDNGTPVFIKKAATGSKPGSAVCSVDINPRPSFEPPEITLTKNDSKLKFDGKTKYEVFVNGEWSGTSNTYIYVDGIYAEGPQASFPLRLKATKKEPAGKPGTLNLTYKYDEKKDVYIAETVEVIP